MLGYLRSVQIVCALDADLIGVLCRNHLNRTLISSKPKLPLLTTYWISFLDLDISLIVFEEALLWLMHIGV